MAVPCSIVNCSYNRNSKKIALIGALPTGCGRKFDHVVVFALELFLVIHKEHAIALVHVLVTELVETEIVNQLTPQADESFLPAGLRGTWARAC